MDSVFGHDPSKPFVKKKNIHDNEKQKNENSCFSRCAIVIVKILLWVVLLIFYLIPIGFGVNEALTFYESILYPAPGKMFDTPVQSLTAALPSTSKFPFFIFDYPSSISMHISCIGPSYDRLNNSNIIFPTIVFEADSNTTGFAFYNVQKLLSSRWRVCVYDRAGYGWSYMSPLGTNRPRISAVRLHTLLFNSGELDNDMKLIIAGHGFGAEVAQIFAFEYPELVAGVAILDGYPNIHKLYGRSSKTIFELTKATCGTLNILRAMETAAFTRPLSRYYESVEKSKGTIFYPSEQLNKYLSSQTNGKYYATIYSDLCMRKNAATQFTDHLTKIGTVPLEASVRWPQIAYGVPVLIVVAGKTVFNGKDSSIYYQQALLYNSTLSNSSTSALVVCNDCEHTFPIDKDSPWLAETLNSYFSPHFVDFIQ
jgi:pimeloyl-ACP methyl ester carboxylesterase